MKKITLLVILILLCSFSMVSCQIYIPSIIHSIIDETPDSFTYTDFTEDEKAIFLDNVGYLPPFIPTDKYEITSFLGDDDYSSGIRYSTYHNSREDFNQFLDSLSSLTLRREDVDEYGDTWYYFTKGEIVLAASYYRTFIGDIIDVFVYIDETEEITLRGTLVNNGKGLPKEDPDTPGVYKVDFSESEHVQDASDLYNYRSGCPTTGKPAVLVIPVQFIDCTAAEAGYSIDKIEKAFSGKGEDTDYYSVEEYYFLSSYGMCDLEITVLDEWFMPKFSSKYYKNQDSSKTPDGHTIGDQMIMDEALDYLDERMDLSKFDSDGNGYIDAVIMINTLPVSNDDYFHWAYRYWNVYSDNTGKLYSYDGVMANDYAWMSYGFMHESTDRWGRPIYTDLDAINTKTYIHEFAHIMGAEDYYDTSYEDPLGPLYGKDMMDSSVGDHNPLTKLHYGWIDSSRLVTTNSSVTLTLEDFSKSGDTIIIANNFDTSLGAYQEYFILMYYKQSGLNDSSAKYFDTDGLVIYHVNASLYYETTDGETLYILNHDNSSSDGRNMLLELVSINLGIVEIPCYVMPEGAVITGLIDDSGSVLPYLIKVDKIIGDTITVTFKKIN